MGVFLIKKIVILIPVLNDLRVLKCIESIRNFDDINMCSIFVLAGNSDSHFCSKVADVLTQNDRLIMEPDSSLFEALNNGLSIVDSEYLGWLGADDIFTKNVKSSEVIGSLEQGYDAVIYSTAYFRNGYITRVLNSKFSNEFFMNWGFHNPHFSTFIKYSITENLRFSVSHSLKGQFSDIRYFYNLLEGKKIFLNPEIAVYMEEGGVGSGSIKSILRNLLQRYKLFKSKNGVIKSVCMVSINYLWKISSRVYYLIFRITI